MKRDSLHEVAVENIAMDRALQMCFTLHKASLYPVWIAK